MGDIAVNEATAYPLDLRKRIVDAVGRGAGAEREGDRLSGAHEAFIYKSLRQGREREVD